MPTSDLASPADEAPGPGGSAPQGAAPPATALRCTPEDVGHAYRAILGRAPESEAVIAQYLRRSPAELAAILLRSAEFRSRLGEIAGNRLTSHALLPPEEVAQAAAWASGCGLLPPQEASAGVVSSSPALLLGALLRAPALAGETDALPPELAPALARLREAPEATALHRLTRPAEPEDGRCLDLLLGGPVLDGPDATEPPPSVPRGLPLHRLLRERIARPAFRDMVLHPLIKGRALPAFGLAAGEAEACAAWIAGRLGGPDLLAGSDRVVPGALLAALLDLPAVQDMIGRAWPEEAAPAAAALPALASGAHRLLAERATAEDVGLAYLAVLGRPAEAAAVRRAAEGATLLSLVNGLIGSGEFRAHVLVRLADDGAAIPHHGLSLAQRRMVDGWVAGRVGVLARPGAAVPLHPMALLARLLTLPVLDAELRRLHGPLWADARAALVAWASEGAEGAIGAIDYVTGDWIVGWAIDRRAGPGAPPLEVEILCNGTLVGFGRADRRRPAAEDGTAEAETAACGFRIPWQGRARLQAGVAEGFRFEIIGRHSGARIGPPFQLDSVFTEPRTTLQLIAGELRQARATLRRLEAMLPQLESFAAFPPEEHAAFRRQHRPLPPPPLPGTVPLPVHVVIAAIGVSVRGLRRTLDSLERQDHAAWTAEILAADPALLALAEAAVARDGRYAVTRLEEGDPGAEAAAERSAAAAAPDAALVLLLPPGMLLADCALAWFAGAARRFPDCPGFFCDEDEVVEEFRDRDRHRAPVFRTALDHWELPRRNPCGTLLCARAPALRAALDHAAGLTDREARRWVSWAALAQAGPVAHIPRLLGSVQAETLEAPPPAAPAPAPTGALRPLLRHPWLLAGTPEAPDTEARISVIVPTRNGGALVRDCFTALTDKADRPEQLDLIVVDNGSDDAGTLAILAGLERGGRARVRRIPEPFNWSRLNNLAAREARGELLLFLNDDTRMLTAGWDRRLRRLLAEPEVGAVGARLVYEDLTIQHAGVVMGLEGLGGHEGVGAAMEEGGPLGRWQSLRCAAAVTGAFLGCRREVFERIGPFDERALPVTFNDVDFCLRLRAAGLRVLYAPEIALVHFESKSRGIDDLDAAKQERAAHERRMLVERWGEAVLLDPGFNPHWSRWTKPFTAIREPSPAEIMAHLAASAAPDPWNPLLRATGGEEAW